MWRPGERLCRLASTVRVVLDAEAARREGPKPIVECKAFTPGIEAAAQFPRAQDDLPKSAIAS